MLRWAGVAGSEGPLDFDKMSQTELLKSDVAKDRISVKPRARKATRQSRKKRDVNNDLFIVIHMGWDSWNRNCNLWLMTIISEN